MFVESIDYNEKLLKLVFADNAKINTRFDCLEFAIPSKQHSNYQKQNLLQISTMVFLEINPLHFWINASR